MEKRIGQLKVGQIFKLDEHSLEYYIKGEYNRSSGRYSCQCFTQGKRYSWLDKGLKKTDKVIHIQHFLEDGHDEGQYQSVFPAVDAWC
jgi:hypothetical protein